ncbi:MAG: hypothetical protein ACOYJY_08315 [Acutalibacteraceae bacterium]|jgi:hypothetical protein
MGTMEFAITSRGDGMEEALKETEILAVQSGLSKKEILRLRLLAEELFGMMRGIVGDLEATYWIEREQKSFSLHLKADLKLDPETRQQLLAVATDGKNEATKGFMGKIRAMIAMVLTPQDAGASMLSMGLMSMGSPGGYLAGSEMYNWTMSQYRAAVENDRANNAGAAQAWDELEKSIVANIADEVRVGIMGTQVEIAILKAF